MIHKRPAFLAGLGLLLMFAGCKKAVDPKVFEADIAKYRDVTKVQLDSLSAQNAALNKNLNEMNARVDKLQDANDRMTAELAAYKELPDVRNEILPDVFSRFQIVSAAQDQFVKSLRDSVTLRSTATQDTMQARIAVMQKMLSEHISFVQFVATEQDSINRVFANRFDSRPWYVSFMGKWEDMQRARRGENP